MTWVLIVIACGLGPCTEYEVPGYASEQACLAAARVRLSRPREHFPRVVCMPLGEVAKAILENDY